jgi:alpha-glucosidase
MKNLIVFLFFLLALRLLAADSLAVSSPDKKIDVTVYYKDKLSYSVKYLGKIILLPSVIDLELQNGKKLSDDLHLSKRSVRSFNGKIISPVPEKRKEIPDVYNELSLQFKEPFALLLRVYNDGVGYRIVTRFKDSITIKNENAEFNFPGHKEILLPLFEPRDGDPFITSFEELYQLKQMDSLTEGSMAFSPVLVGDSDEVKVAITESDLEDYPGMFLKGTNRNALLGVFAPYPLEEKMTKGEFPRLLLQKSRIILQRRAVGIFHGES